MNHANVINQKHDESTEMEDSFATAIKGNSIPSSNPAHRKVAVSN